MIRITKDYLADIGAGNREGMEIHHMPLYGTERVMGESDVLPHEGPTTVFRLIDDDGNRLYDGVLTNDEDCTNQIAALRWGEADAGATEIRIRRGAAWVQEIG